MSLLTRVCGVTKMVEYLMGKMIDHDIAGMHSIMTHPVVGDIATYKLFIRHLGPKLLLFVPTHIRPAKRKKGKERRKVISRATAGQ